MTNAADKGGRCPRAFWYELYNTEDGGHIGVGYGHKPGENGVRGGAWTGRWTSRMASAPHLQEIDPCDPFKVPWVSGRRPAQWRDRPKFKYQGKHADMIIMDDVVVNMDFAEIEKRLAAFYLAQEVNECQDLLARRRFERSVFLGLKSVEARTRYLNSLRNIP